MLDPRVERLRSSGSRLDGSLAEARVGQRHRRDDVSAGPSREPQGDAAAVLEDLRRRFERVLQGVPEGVWAHI
jgi:hypothetical protein